MPDDDDDDEEEESIKTPTDDYSDEPLPEYGTPAGGSKASSIAAAFSPIEASSAAEENHHGGRAAGGRARVELRETPSVSPVEADNNNNSGDEQKV